MTNCYLKTGTNPAVSIGTEVFFGCPAGLVFKNNWYMTPILRVRCQETGVFDQPPSWPTCIDRMFNIHILVLQVFSERAVPKCKGLGMEG